MWWKAQQAAALQKRENNSDENDTKRFVKDVTIGATGLAIAVWMAKQACCCPKTEIL